MMQAIERRSTLSTTPWINEHLLRYEWLHMM